jgi:hypothetical protein
VIELQKPPTPIEILPELLVVRVLTFLHPHSVWQFVEACPIISDHPLTAIPLISTAFALIKLQQAGAQMVKQDCFFRALLSVTKELVRVI